MQREKTYTAVALLPEEDNMQRFWLSEEIGITDMGSKGDEEPYQLFTNSIIRDAEGRYDYEVKRSWRPEQGKALHLNYGLALGRLRFTIKILQGTPE
ncbi:unnamed protein product [Gongylonema pulchrum]|uniref:Lipoprotein n=1 Tax=Gongylonema pulchrum TaxID=637853 RepID=A0A183DNR5_9BILA|nr:unnamed protein product [Gongylonema pulchrum]